MHFVTIVRAAAALAAVGVGATSMHLVPGLSGGVNTSTGESVSVELNAVDSGERRSYYQAGASLTDSLPSMPGDFSGGAELDAAPPSLPFLTGGTQDSGMVSPPVQPAVLPDANSLPTSSPLGDVMPPASNAGGLPTSRGTVPGRSLSDDRLTPNAPPPQSIQGSSRNVAPPAATNLRNRAMEEQDSNWAKAQRAMGQANGPMGQDNSAMPRDRVPGQPAAYAPPQGNDLRAFDRLRTIEDQQREASTRNAQQFATGLPFVTGPPPGRYFTSPYNHALFQNAAFQRTYARQASSNPPPTGQLASAQSVVPNQNLPQYMAPGVYPTAYQCGPPMMAPNAVLPQPSLPQTGAIPGAYVPPTITPNLAPNLYTPSNAGYSPVLSLGQEGYNVQLGRGIVGQPTVYVPGQPVRNFLRYLFP